MKLFRKYSLFVLMGLALTGSVALTSCNDDKDEFSTNQYTGGIKLNVWGPCPVARGGELRFLGSGMNQITGITLPGSEKITDLKLISNEEVRITVPQDAVEGYVTLHTSQGDITSITKLTFLEPISLDEISPMTIKPGQTLTLSGEYLNNIHEVIFSEDKANADVTVPEEEFITHTRQEISLVVPVEAKTGAIILSDADEEMPNWIISDEMVTVVVPSVDEILNLESANPGDKITISGTDLDLVVAVVMSNGEEVEYIFTPVENGDGSEGHISFTVPDNACNGPICLVTASGIEIVAVNVGECQPQDLVAVPSVGLRGGNEVVITGKNLQMISGVSLPTSGDPVYVDFNLDSNEKLSFTFPADAQSGDVVLSLKGGGEVYLNLETAKPEVLTTESLPAGAEVTVQGKNLDLLVSVTYADGTTVNVENPAADQAILNIPVTAVSGKASLNMGNGESSSWEANISAPTGSYIIEGPGEEDEVSAGEIAAFTVGNPDMLKGILVNGEAVQYILNGTTLFINLPTSCGKGTIITLISTDGSQLDYTYDFIPATHAAKIIWSGLVDLAGWGEKIYIEKSAFEEVPAGALMTFHISAYSGFQIQLNNANWQSFDTLSEWTSWADMTSISIELTAEILNNILTTDDGWSNNGLIIQGDGCVISQIDIEWENSLEIVVPFNWADVDMGNYSINLEGSPGTALIEAGVKTGSILRLYCTPYADYNLNDPQVHIQIFDGHWNAMTFDEINGGGQFNEATWGDMSLIEIKVTPDMYEKFTTFTDWGYCIIFQGRNIILNKVTIE